MKKRGCYDDDDDNDQPLNIGDGDDEPIKINVKKRQRLRQRANERSVAGFKRLEQTVIDKLRSEHEEIQRIEEQVERYKNLFERVDDREERLEDYHKCNGCKVYVPWKHNIITGCRLVGKHTCVYNCGTTKECALPMCGYCRLPHCVRDGAMQCYSCKSLVCEVSRLVSDNRIFCSYDCLVKEDVK